MPELARLDGLLVDPSRSIIFTFEGAPVSGFGGDTIASALAANGQWMLSRSFKYRRPRGAFSMAGHDANTLVQLPDEPNVFADLYPISDGLAVSGQNYDGSLARDRGAWVGRMGRFLPPGFYYKAFFRPRGAWRLWEPLIRRKAGLGHVDPNSRHDERDKAYAFAETVVIGGGTAGMSAALRSNCSSVSRTPEWGRHRGELPTSRRSGLPPARPEKHSTRWARPPRAHLMARPPSRPSPVGRSSRCDVRQCTTATSRPERR